MDDDKNPNGFDLNESDETASPLAPTPEVPSKVDESTPRRKLPLWAKILIMAAIVFLGGISYLRTHFHQDTEDAVDVQEDTGQVSDAPAPEKRKPMPDVELIAGSGPNKHLSDFRGKVVVLSFWASWCAPCLVELPSFIELHKKIASDALAILPVNVDEPDAAANFVPHFWKTKDFPFPTFFDPNHKASDQLNIDVLPSNFVIDKQGRLVAQGFGENDWGSDTTVTLIKQLLQEK